MHNVLQTWVQSLGWIDKDFTLSQGIKPEELTVMRYHQSLVSGIQAICFCW